LTTENFNGNKNKIMEYANISSFVGYNNENWAIKARYPGRITATGMKYMRKTTGFTWTDYKTNTKIAKELNITSVLKKYANIEEIGCNI
jgi:ribosomal protein S17E